MRGYLNKSDQSPPALQSNEGVNIEEFVRQSIMNAGLSKQPKVNSLQLFYIRQVTGEIDGKKIVYYFEPEFAYVADIGMPRLPLIEVLYQVPTVPDGPGEYRTIGRGDGNFPNFKTARAFSVAGTGRDQLLYAASAGVLIIGAKEGVTEAALQAALQGYVQELRNSGSYYVARLPPFDEEGAARRIMAEVDEVRYAELDTKQRSVVAPWYVDRVV